MGRAAWVGEKGLDTIIGDVEGYSLYECSCRYGGIYDCWRGEEHVWLSTRGLRDEIACTCAIVRAQACGFWSGDMLRMQREWRGNVV